MSSQKGNVSRSRGQKHQNATAFRNDKYGASVQVKKAKAQVHEGVCQHCRDVLQWKVKYNKYKPLSQPRKCVKCLKKTVKDAYHVMCKQCALKLQLCAKCGKQEDVVISSDQKQDHVEDANNQDDDDDDDDDDEDKDVDRCE